MKNTIKICSNHSEYQVPLIWTFAFSGSEYWCPYCGNNGGMFGIGEDVEITEKLIGRQKIYKDYSESFLSAKGYLCCSAFKIEGKRINRNEMPDAMRKELVEVADKYSFYNIKAMDLIEKEIPQKLKFGCGSCKYIIKCEEFDNGFCNKWERE